MRTTAEILEPLCSAREGARLVGVTPQAVRVRVRKGELDGDSSLGVLVVRRDQLAEWCLERERRALEKDF